MSGAVMPFITKILHLNMWPDIVEHNIQFITASNTITSVTAPPGDSVSVNLAGGGGVYLVTFGDGPYISCPYARASISPTSVSLNPFRISVSPPSNTVNTSTILIYDTAGGVYPSAGSIISVTYKFRQSGVP